MKHLTTCRTPAGRPAGRPVLGTIVAAVLVLFGLGIARTACAADITISPGQMTAIANMGAGQNHPRVNPDPASPTGLALGFFDPASWAEFTYVVPASGLYKVTIDHASGDTNPAVFQLDNRLAGSSIHYATEDIPVPVTGDWGTHQVIDPNVTMPLHAGTNTMRLQSVRNIHVTDHANGQVGGHNVGAIFLTKVGSLPATGTISGKVQASDLGSQGVEGAYVMANAAANTVPEPGPLWVRGFWTTSNALGNFALPVSAGTYTVQAGRPDTYKLAGGSATGLAVSAGGTANATVNIQSNWTGATPNQITVESEYFHAKTPDAIGGPDATGISILPNAAMSNGYKLGWVDTNDYVDLFVDVPPGQGGWYKLTHIYSNGGAEGTVRYSTERGSVAQDTTPPGATWDTQVNKIFTDPIYLFPGANTIREYEVQPNSDFDAFTLTKTTRSASSTIRVEAESYVNAGTGSAVSRTGGAGVGVSTDATTVSTYDGQKLSGGAAIGNYSSYKANGAAMYVEYNVTATQDGMYNVAVRAAFPPVPVNLRFWNLTYGPIVDESFNTDPAGGPADYGADKQEVYNLPNPVPLKTGPNVIRVYITLGGLNPDYFDFTLASPLTGFGLVQGTVKTTLSGVASTVSRAQLSADVSDAGLLGVPALGFRSVSDDHGHYFLLLPTGARTVAAAAQAYDDPTATGATAPVTITDGGSATQDLTLVRNDRYEAEWFDSGIADTPSAMGVVDATLASQGQALGAFDNGAGKYADYNVTVPSDGVYSVKLTYSSQAGTTIRLVSLTTGSQFDEAVPATGDFNTYLDADLANHLALKAGVNTIRLSNTTGAGFNPDAFTIAPVSGTQAGTLKGTAYNTAATPAVPLEGVSVTVTDANNVVVGTATTDANGNYSLLLPAGTYTVTPSKTGFAGAAQPATVPAGGSVTVNLNMVSGGVSGKVVDQAGQPVANTFVTAFDSTGAQLNVTSTDANGAYSLNIPAGQTKLVAGAPMSLPANVTVTVGASTKQDLTVTRLGGGVPIPLPLDIKWFTKHDPADLANHTVGIDGDFSLPGEQALPAGNNTVQGVVFNVADPNADPDLMTLANGNNTITVPSNIQGKHAALVVVALSDSGSFPGNSGMSPDATITYADSTTDTASVSLPDWYAGETGSTFGPNDNGANNPLPANVWEIVHFTHRHSVSFGVNGDGAHNFRFYSVVLPLNPNKVVTDIALPADTNGFVAPTPIVYAVSFADAATIHVPFSYAIKAMKIAGGLVQSDGTDMTNLNVVTTSPSGTTITVQDAIALAKQAL